MLLLASITWYRAHRMEESKLIGGRYRIVRKIAEGGMGAVFEAKHHLSKKSVALKILFEQVGQDEAARQRFLREVSAPAQIGHDGIVEVYDAGFDIEDGSLFVAMELLQGEPLRDRLAKGGLTLETLLDIFEEMLHPLAAAHDKGIVHRDLKPENVFMATNRSGEESVKLLDFGIARDLDAAADTNVTRAGVAMGTPHYMAPEQAMSARDVRPAADVWAVAVMLYEALSGRVPFDGETASAIVVHACTQAHVPLGAAASELPITLGQFVDRCLAKDPLERPANAGEMLKEFQQVRRGLSGPGGPDPKALGIAATAVLPGVGTAPVSGVPHVAQYVPGPGSAPGVTPGSAPGYGTGPAPGYSAPGYSAPGYSAPGHSGPAFSAPGVSAPGGYTSGPGAGGGTYGHTAVPVPARKGGRAIVLIIIAFVLIGGFVVFGGLAGVGYFYFAGSALEEPIVASTADIRVDTNVAAGELMVDGTSRGTLVPGQVFRIRGGARRLQVQEAGRVVADTTLQITNGQPQTVLLNRDPVLAAAPGPAVALTNVQTFRGSLQQGNSQLNSGEFVVRYNFNWTAGTTVRLDCDSDAFDTYLILKSPSHQQQDDDDGGEGTNASMLVQLTETGQFEVVVTSYRPGAVGDFRLTVSTP